MAVTGMKAKNAVESLREIVQDLLVPEIKAIKVEIASLHGETKSLRNETHTGFDTLRNEMHAGFDAIRTEMRLRDEKRSQAIQSLSEKLSYAIDIRERLAVLADRAARS